MNALKYAVSVAVLVVAMQGCFDNKSTESGKEKESASESSVTSSVADSSVSSVLKQSISSSSTADASSSANTTVPVPQSGSSSSAHAVTAPTVKAVALSISVKELPENNATTASVEVSYSDGRKKDFSSGIAWSIGDPNVLEVKGTKLVAIHEGTSTVQATVNGKASPKQTVTVYKVIHGHRLPPEPDEQLNNSTLLGIDSNFNGVRDDVERWIYLNYTNPAEIGTFMQSAKAYQIVIQDPASVNENLHWIKDASDCRAYWSLRAKREGEAFWMDRYRNYEREIKPIYFNTNERWNAYDTFNFNLSGGVYGTTGLEDLKSKCDFNLTNTVGD